MPFEPSAFRSAGFEKGDFLPLATFGGNNSLPQTTSNTYEGGSNISGAIKWRLTWSEVFGDKDIRWMFSGQARPNGDAIDFQLFNQRDDEVILEETGIANTEAITIGPSDPYTPTTTDSEVTIMGQFRNHDNVTEVGLLDYAVLMGVEL